MATRYKVIFVNDSSGSVDHEQLKQELAARFKLTSTIIDKLLSVDEMVVKKNVDIETAARFKGIIDAMGVSSRIEAIVDDEHNAPGDVDFVERRKGERRQQADRRNVHRAGAIQPDRRKSDRRKS